MSRNVNINAFLFSHFVDYNKIRKNFLFIFYIFSAKIRLK